VISALRIELRALPYRLQTGEYCGNFIELSAEQVRQLAYDALLRFWPRRPSISCFKADDCAFSA
jgi:hypothetical protein